MPTLPQTPIQIQPTSPVPPHLQIIQEKVDGVFEGGGALGAAYIGALNLLENHHIWFSRVAGTSAGAITAAMIAVGFTASEIEWLCSSYPNHSQAPASLANCGITTPIDFSSFLDFPTLNDFDRDLRRKTILWRLFKGEFIDQIGELNIPIPTKEEALVQCLNGLVNIPLVGAAVRASKGLVRDALSLALIGLPEHHLKVKDLAMIDTKSLREGLADDMWNVVMQTSPLYYLVTTLMHKGALFAGDVFYKTLSELFGKKFDGHKDTVVRFKHLKIPLAILAADIDRGSVVVYSSYKNPEVSVMDAVRQSMSIPFVFEPQGSKRQLVDGGVFSNFPIWLFTKAGDTYWDPTVVSDQRVKIGFTLDEHRPAPSTWNVQKARFPVSGEPKRVNKWDALKPLLADKLIKAGFSPALVENSLTDMLYDGVTPNPGSKPTLVFLQEALGVLDGVMSTEDATRSSITNGLMVGKRYIDINIPLLGFTALDFYINGNQNDLKSIFNRGWYTAIDAFSTVTAPSIHYQITQTEKNRSPFA